MKKAAVKIDKGKASNAPGGVTAALLNRPKQATALDGQKSQNINIMLAKFGSRTKVESILEVNSYFLVLISFYTYVHY